MNGADVNNIIVGGSTVRLVDLNGTMIWRNFDNLSSNLKVHGPILGFPSNSYTLIAANVVAFNVKTYLASSGFATGATVNVKYALSESLYYEFFHKVIYTGFMGHPEQIFNISKNGTHVAGPIVSSFTNETVNSSGGIGWDTIGDTSRTGSPFLLCWSAPDATYSDSINLVTNSNYYKNDFPKLYVSFTNNNERGESDSRVSYEVHAKSFR